MRAKLLTRFQGAGPLAVRPSRSRRDHLAVALVGAGTLLLFLVGAGLALGALAGRPPRGAAVNVVIGFAFLVTITVVIALFTARPGGNAATAVAFGGYVALAANGTIKGGAILMATRRQPRTPW